MFFPSLVLTCLTRHCTKSTCKLLPFTVNTQIKYFVQGKWIIYQAEQCYQSQQHIWPSVPTLQVFSLSWPCIMIILLTTYWGLMFTVFFLFSFPASGRETTFQQILCSLACKFSPLFSPLSSV